MSGDRHLGQCTVFAPRVDLAVLAVDVASSDRSSIAGVARRLVVAGAVLARCRSRPRCRPLPVSTSAGRAQCRARPLRLPAEQPLVEARDAPRRPCPSTSKWMRAGFPAPVAAARRSDAVLRPSDEQARPPVSTSASPTSELGRRGTPRFLDERLEESLRPRLPRDARGRRPRSVATDPRAPRACRPRPRRLDEPLADPAEALVVMRLHAARARRAPCRAALPPRSRPRARRTRRASPCASSSPTDLGQVLDEVAAARDVQDLAAAADREHRHVALERRRRAARARRGRGRAAMPFVSGCGSAPYSVRVEVGAAGEDEPVERLERLLDRRPRSAARAAAGRRRARPRDVVERDERRRGRAHAPHARAAT